jgi:hypothetical protein
VYSIVQFVPDMKLDERVNIGYFVGNNERGFGAEWRPERAELFGIDIRERLGEWLSSLKPLTVEKLIDLGQVPRTYFHVTTPRITIIDDLQEAAAVIGKTFLTTNEEYQERWKNYNANLKKPS